MPANDGQPRQRVATKEEAALLVGAVPANLERISLHEARHTYASFLMAAGYNLKQIQEYLSHGDLVTTGRYIKNLPVPMGTTQRAKLEAYLETEIGDL